MGSSLGCSVGCSLGYSDGWPVGQVAARLVSAMRSINGATDDAAHAAAHASISEIREAGIKVTDKSPVMNTELVSALQLEGLVSIAEAIADLG